MRKPLYHRRRDLVLGLALPAIDEIEAGEKVLKNDYEGFTPPSRKKWKGESISNFWLTAMKNHPGIAFTINEHDEKALAHLTDIECSYLCSDSTNDKQKDLETDSNGYKLTFHFHRNPYFTNRILEKTYYYIKDEVGQSGELLYKHATALPIDWKEGKDLTQANGEEGASDDGEEGPVPSFFSFFYPRLPPPNDVVEKKKMDQETYDQIVEIIESDFQCGEDIRDEVSVYAYLYRHECMVLPKSFLYFYLQIIPYATTYFVDPPEFDYDDDEDDDDDNDDGDNDDDDNDDNDDYE
jgi:nucleosome assembly protein 1-like 1